MVLPRSANPAAMIPNRTRISAMSYSGGMTKLSPTRPARLAPARECAPIQMGGWGSCTQAMCGVAPVICQCFPR